MSTNSKEQASVVMFMKGSPSLAARLDNHRARLRPVPTRAAVLRAALTDYLTRQEAAPNTTEIPPQHHQASPAKSWR